MDKQIIPKTGNQKLIYGQRSKNLVKCLTDGNKLELAELVSDIMPGGKPDLTGVINYPKITRLIKENGRQGVRATIFLIVKNFCESLNVVRSMNEDQMIEAASFLLDECGNYRLEDYVMMFTMAKRGQLIKILDRVDIQIIGQIFNEYDRLRTNAGERYYEAQIESLDAKTEISPDNLDTEKEKKYSDNWNKAAKMFGEYVEKSREMQDKKREQEIEESEKRRLQMLKEYEEYKKSNGITDDKPMIDLSEFKSNENVKSKSTY